jgi:uncharacterized membrane protein YfcA
VNNFPQPEAGSLLIARCIAALLGLGSFGATVALTLFAMHRPNMEKLLGVKLTLDASVAAFHATRQLVNFRSLCSWCTGTAIAAGVMAYDGRGAIGRTWSQAATILWFDGRFSFSNEICRRLSSTGLG